MTQTNTSNAVEVKLSRRQIAKIRREQRQENLKSEMDARFSEWNRLTTAEARALKHARWDSGELRRDVAKILGCSIHHINNYLSPKTFRKNRSNRLKECANAYILALEQKLKK